jgi:hypothetical protein
VAPAALPSVSAGQTASPSAASEWGKDGAMMEKPEMTAS